MQEIGVDHAVAIGTGGQAAVVLLAASPVEGLVRPQHPLFFWLGLPFLFDLPAALNVLHKLVKRYGVHGEITFPVRSTDYPLT
jgi:hypothetical protein